MLRIFTAMSCGNCEHLDKEWLECEVYHMHVDFDEVRDCKDFEERTCGTCEHLGESCYGPYGVDTNTCDEWELKK